MEKIAEELNKAFNDKYNYLKLYEVTYDCSNLECVVTFLYPHTINEICEEDRKEINEFVSKWLNLNGKTVVKFKKSFLDKRLVRSEIFNFINTNFKALSVYINENQIDVEESEECIKVKIKIAREIKEYFDSINAASRIRNYLLERFISDFEVEGDVEDNLHINREIGEVEIPVIFRKNYRYKVNTVHPLFGGDIAPEPEFIKDNKEPKEGLILAGKISQMQKKTFTRKKGKRAGEEGTYYSFVLDDGKKIECIYFASKANIKKMDFLQDEMTILCLGDLKLGLGNKLTYYIKRVAVATVDEESKKPPQTKVPEKRKNVVLVEDFISHRQDDLFTKEIIYNDYIMNNNFVVYDLETTGIDTATDRIIEIGAIKVEKGRVTKKFSTFVNPEMHIPEEASRVNNITDDMVADAPKIGDVMLDFLDFASGCVISGYNNINFDNKFIARYAKELGLSFNNENIDVYVLARQKQVSSKNYKLTTVAAALGVSLEGAHRAYNDAYATAQVLLKLNEEKNN